MKFITAHTLYVIVLCGLVAGCAGAYGATDLFVLSIEQSSTISTNKRVEFGSFAVASDANTIFTAGAMQPHGAFNEKDEEIFKRSLKDTLNTVRWPADEEAKSVWIVHVLLRRQILAFDGKSVSLLAVVSWCLASRSGKIVYQEQFYAADSGVLVFTIGGIKNSVNQAIVRRITETSLLLSSSNSNSKSFPLENTYDSIEKAASVLHKQINQPRFFRADDVKTIPWETLDVKEPVNWENRIQLP